MTKICSNTLEMRMMLKAGVDSKSVLCAGAAKSALLRAVYAITKYFFFRLS